MGKMKEKYIEIIEKEYKGDHDAYLQDLAKKSCEEYYHMENVLCPNCMVQGLYRNEDDITCDVCAQHYVQVDNSLRFK